MRTIHKYELSIIDDIQEFNLTNSYSINHFGEQDGKLMMWADIRTESVDHLTKIQVIGTGHDIGEYRASHLQTVQMSNGLVWHIYEVG